MFRRKTTFAFIAAALFASQVFAANPWLAEKNGQSILKAELPPCTADGPAQNRSFTVRDCTTKISCATTGTETVRMVCDGTTWRAINATATAVDLGDYVLITKAGQQTWTATGAGNDATITAVDDVAIAANDFLPTAVATAVVTAPVTNIVASTSSTVTTPTLSLAVTTLAVDAGGGTDELGIAADSVSVSTGIAFRIVGGAAPPVACAAGTAGTIYYDTTINKFCVCNATAYVLMNDDSTTTGCS